LFSSQLPKAGSAWNSASEVEPGYPITLGIEILLTKKYSKAPDDARAGAKT
jgi:hypothetical protein